MMKNVLLLGSLAIVNVSCGSNSDNYSATMGATVASESLKSDVDLFNYLSTKKSRSVCRLSVNKIGGSEAVTFDNTYSYELAAQIPGTTGQSTSDWKSVFLPSNFKMNLIHENLGYANSIKINRDSGENESLDYVIHTQVVVEQDNIFIPIPVRIGGGRSLHRSSGKLLFSADGNLKSIHAKREILENRLLGKRWKLLGSVVECEN